MTRVLIPGPEPSPDCPVPGMHIWGWMTNFELEALIEMASRMESVVEIGSLHGRSSFALATACSGPVHCIDPWHDEGGHCLPSFMGNVGFMPNVHPVQAHNSRAIAKKIGKVDMVFIDGAHAYGAVLADIAAWLPWTQRIMCGHDYQNEDGGYPGVKQAVDQVFGDAVYVPEGTSIWVVDKPVGGWSIGTDLPKGRLEYTDEYGRTDSPTLVWP